jgi:hypothetical protein
LFGGTGPITFFLISEKIVGIARLFGRRIRRNNEIYFDIFNCQLDVNLKNRRYEIMDDGGPAISNLWIQI